MPKGLLECVSELEESLTALRSRCTTIESECGNLRGRIQALHESRALEEDAHATMMKELGSQVEKLNRQLSSSISASATATSLDSMKKSRENGVSFREREKSVIEIASSSATRPVKSRKATAFERKEESDEEDEDSREGGRRARFRDHDSVMEIPDSTGAGPGRSTKKRVPTSFAPAADEEDDDSRDGGRRARFRDHDSIMEIPDSTGDDGPRRSTKKRIPTSFTPAGKDPAKDLSKQVSFTSEGEEPNGEETIEFKPQARPERKRVPTAFTRHPVEESDVESSTDESDEEEKKDARPRRKRLSDGGFSGEKAMAKMGDNNSTDEPSPSSRGAQRRFSWGRDKNGNLIENPDIDQYRIVGGPKDGDLIEKVLQSVYFFKDLDEKARGLLISEMEVYEFDNGADVCREGNTKGTHFFIIAKGQFSVLRGGQVISEITRGAAFGESVILLSGRQNATVRAMGKCTAYGMRGTEVRKLLQQSYKDERKEVVDAINMAIEDGGCCILQKLTASQTQVLYDRAQARRLARGEILIEERSRDFDTVYVTIQGAFCVRKKGQPLEELDRFSLVGDTGILFSEMPASVTAEQPSLTLGLSRSMLKDMFSDKLQEVLLRSRLMNALVRFNEACSENGTGFHMSNEQLDALVGLGKFMDLRKGEELEQRTRLAFCIYGEIDVRKDTTAPWSRLSGITCDGFPMDTSAESLSQPFNLKAKAVTASKLVFWLGRGLDGIFEMAKHKTLNSPVHQPIEHHPQLPPEVYNRSASMRMALVEDDKTGALRKVFVLRTLTSDQLEILAASLEVLNMKEGDVVFSKGDQADAFYIIHSGLVEILIGTKRIRTLGMGDYLGERALLFREARSATVKVVEDCELWRMNSETFNKAVQGPIVEYMKDRIAFQDTKVELGSLKCSRVIGRGGFGVVKMVQNPATGTRYALKGVRKRLAVEQRQQESLCNERSILAELDHPFIIKYVRSFNGRTCVYFLMELVTGGELLDALDELGLLSKVQARFYISSISLALEFLHERRIAYLDLKGENCLIDHHGYLKMVDFGIAERVKDGRIYAVKGTPLFMAPEVILGKGYTTTADLWSLGVCLYDFMIGRFPFADDNAGKSEVFRAILKSPLTFPNKVPLDKDSKQLLQGLLNRDPRQRLGAGAGGYQALKAHPFFENFSWDGLLARQLEPPFKPVRETYAEDQELGVQKAPEGYTESVEDDFEEDAGWVDPDPRWQEEFL